MIFQNLNIYPSQFDNFFSWCLDLFLMYFPTTIKKVSDKNKTSTKIKWYNNELLNKKKKTLYEISKTSKDSDAKLKYKFAMNEYKQAIINAKYNANIKFIETSSNKYKSAWKLKKTTSILLSDCDKR